MSESTPFDAPSPEPTPLHTAIDEAPELGFEWMRRMRDAGIALNPTAERRAEARASFLAGIQEQARRTALQR